VSIDQSGNCTARLASSGNKDYLPTEAVGHFIAAQRPSRKLWPIGAGIGAALAIAATLGGTVLLKRRRKVHEA